MTRTAFYLPPFGPGLFVAWIITTVRHGESMSAYGGIVVATISNAALYVWAAFRVIKAEILAGGRLGRYFDNDTYTSNQTGARQ